jgi:hypothetical protein
MHTYTCTVLSYIATRVQTDMRTHTRTHTYMHTRLNARMHTRTYMGAYMHTHTYACMHACMHTHMHTHTCTQCMEEISLPTFAMTTTHTHTCFVEHQNVYRWDDGCETRTSARSPPFETASLPPWTSLVHFAQQACLWLPAVACSDSHFPSAASPLPTSKPRL